MPGEEWVTHLASFHSPAQEEGHPIVGIQFIYWQVKRPDFLDLLCGVVHLRRVVTDFLPVCDHIEPVRIDDLQALVRAEVQQGVRAVLQLVLDLLPIEGNHLIEVDFVPVRQAAEKGIRPKHTGTEQDLTPQLRVLREGDTIPTLIQCSPGFQPYLRVLHGEVGGGQHHPDGPAPPLLPTVRLCQLPVSGQIDEQLRPFQFFLPTLLRETHPMPAQADSDQSVVVMLRPGRDDGDLQRVIWVAVVREELGIDTELLVDMYFHMAENVIVGRGNGLLSDDLLPLVPIQFQGIFLLQILLAVSHQLLGVYVIRGQGQPAFCVFIGGGCGAVCHQAGVAHPGIPVGIVLTLGADGLQQINGVPEKISIHFSVLAKSTAVTQHRQIAVGSAQF